MFNAKKIDSSVGVLFSSLTKKKRELFILYKISQQWSSFVDSMFARCTYPLRLVRDKTCDAYILLVVVCNNSVGTQFYYSKEKLLSKITLHLGYDVVTDIRIVLKPFEIETSGSRDNIEDLLVDAKGPEALTDIKELDLQKNLLKLLCRVRNS